MNKTTHRRGAAILLLLMAGTTALAGCGSIGDMINRQKTETHENAQSFDADATVEADRVPDDATEITVRTPAEEEGGAGVILLASTSEPAGDCREAERRSAPLLTIDGAPDVYDSTNSGVLVCGEWTVMRSSDGWFGWTPNAEDHAGR